MKKSVSLLLAVLGYSLLGVAPAAAQSAFSFQGRLSDAAGPANGRYEFEFSLWDASDGGGLASPTVLGTPGAIGVTNGLFTVILDFGASALNGASRWVQLGVRTNGSATPFVPVTPRQSLPVTPMAVFATRAGGVSAGSVGTSAIAANAVTGAKIAPGEVVRGINNLKDAVTLQAGSNVVLATTGSTITISAITATGSNGQSWAVGGNSDTTATNFLGTRDNQPLELRVNNMRALRLEPNGLGQPNLIAGNTNNAAAPGLVGVVVAGGATNTIGSSSHWSTIGGGRANAIRDGAYSSGIFTGNGIEIQANSPYALVGGGYNNRIQNDAQAAIIVGGFENFVGSNAQFSVVTGGRENVVLADGAFAVIGGGNRNTNQIAARFSAIGGGRENTIQSNAQFGVIIGGYQNVIHTNTLSATVVGGAQNRAAGSYSLAAGNRAKANHNGSFVWADATGADFTSSANHQFLVRAAGGVGIGTNRPASALHVLGTITATSFAGNGGGLTNLPATALAGILILIRFQDEAIGIRVGDAQKTQHPAFSG